MANTGIIRLFSGKDLKARRRNYMSPSIRQALSKVLIKYHKARHAPFKGHILARFIRESIPKTLEKNIDNPQAYQIHGSARQGNWARVPWIAVFDILITETAQTGYYPMYLFREDMKGVYLSMNQGVIDIRQKYQENPKDVLKIKASDFRAQMGGVPLRFSVEDIDLATETSLELASFYESGNICSRFYAKGELPSDEELVEDFREMMEIYQFLGANETAVDLLKIGAYEESLGKTGEDLKKFRQHWRVEHNSKLSRAAKKVHGYQCQACGFNFENVYGRIGREFIEAHHLVPISLFKGQIEKLDPKMDFAVLCSNCHRMIHKMKNPDDVSALKKKLKK